jgi:hypothetical protein
VVYVLVAEKVKSAAPAYNFFAILALDAFSMLIWLSAMGATAAKRGTFQFPVNASCSSDGSAVNSGRCDIWKRTEVMSVGALAILSGIAGLCALELIFFIATFTYMLISYLNLRKTGALGGSGKTMAMSAGGHHEMESKPQPYVDANPYQAQQPQFAQSPQTAYHGAVSQGQIYQPPQQQYTQPPPPQQQQQQQQQYTQPMAGAHEIHTPQQQYSQATGAHEMYTQSQAHMISPASTPAPQQQGYQYPPVH